MLQVILGSFGVFPIFNNLVPHKLQVIVCHLLKQSVKAPRLLVFFMKQG